MANTNHDRPPVTLSWLRRIPALARLDERRLREIARSLQCRDVPAGHVLIEPLSTRPTPMYLIIEGWAAVVVRDEPVDALGPGDVIDEDALADRDQPTTKVLAKTPLHYVEIEAARIYESGAGAPTAKETTR